MEYKFEDCINKIICADCLTVMKDWPDGCVDLVLTDPVYGMEYESNHYKNGNPFGKLCGDTEYPVTAIKECIRVARCSVLAFCRWDNLGELPKPKSFIVWKKNNWTAGDLEHEYGRMWEGIVFYPQKFHAFNKYRPHDILECDRVSATQLLHPTQKPINLCELLITQHIGDIVLDPLCGSGTTCLAAKKLGHRFIGIDISPAYCEIARERLKAVDTGVPVKEARKGQQALFE